MIENIVPLLESDYLIISNKKKCRDILIKLKASRGWGEDDMVDFLISLHIVLEVSLNKFFRLISLSGIKKEIDELTITANLDSISFVDKTTLFIYNSSFDFGGNLSKANEYHSIIGTIKNFNEVRNKLLHGHSICSIFDGKEYRHSKARSLVNPDNIQKQINKFIEIMEGVRFFFDCLNTSINESGKEAYKKACLNYDFLCVPKNK